MPGRAEQTQDEPRAFERTLPWAKGNPHGKRAVLPVDAPFAGTLATKLFQVDPGLGLDFILCVADYILVRAIFG